MDFMLNKPVGVVDWIVVEVVDWLIVEVVRVVVVEVVRVVVVEVVKVVVVDELSSLLISSPIIVPIVANTIMATKIVVILAKI